MAASHPTLLSGGHAFTRRGLERDGVAYLHIVYLLLNWFDGGVFQGHGTPYIIASCNLGNIVTISPIPIFLQPHDPMSNVAATFFCLSWPWMPVKGTTSYVQFFNVEFLHFYNVYFKSIGCGCCMLVFTCANDKRHAMAMMRVKAVT